MIWLGFQDCSRADPSRGKICELFRVPASLPRDSLDLTNKPYPRFRVQGRILGIAGDAIRQGNKEKERSVERPGERERERERERSVEKPGEDIVIETYLERLLQIWLELMLRHKCCKCAFHVQPKSYGAGNSHSLMVTIVMKTGTSGAFESRKIQREVFSPL